MSAFASSMALPASHVAASERAAFIRRTYLHLALAILAFTGIEAALFQTELGPIMLGWINASPINWLFILGGFIVVGWIASSVAHTLESPVMQYLALGLYVFAEAIIFMPILYIAVNFSSLDVLPMAAGMTMLLFFGLTATVFITRKDFSFLRSALMIGGFIALGLIVCGAVFGFTLGLLFSGAMVVLAMGAILYDTSNVLHHYPTDRHVAAALSLFASIALLFWYVLRILIMIAASRD
jgi:FtsH-binding integral membrane protein